MLNGWDEYVSNPGHSTYDTFLLLYTCPPSHSSTFIFPIAYETPRIHSSHNKMGNCGGTHAGNHLHLVTIIAVEMTRPRQHKTEDIIVTEST